jgi:hypothetical protein
VIELLVDDSERTETVNVVYFDNELANGTVRQGGTPAQPLETQQGGLQERSPTNWVAIRVLGKGVEAKTTRGNERYAGTQVVSKKAHAHCKLTLPSWRV